MSGYSRLLSLTVVLAATLALAQKPCESNVYLTLKQQAPDSLSDHDLDLLLDFHEYCMEDNEDRGYPTSPCEDSLYAILAQRPYQSLSKNQTELLKALEESCLEYRSDMEREKKWKKIKTAIPFAIAGAGLATVAVITFSVISIKVWLETPMVD